MGSVPAATATVREIWRAQRADGPAAVLAIGTANPEKFVPQDEFPDFFFRATNSDHLTALKDKFKRVCQKLGVQKRYLHHTEELLRAHPEFIDHDSPSLDARLDIVATAVPELAAQASKKAIAEWGRPATDITHLVVTTNSGAHIPGVDFRLIPLLGLRPSVRRTMLYLNGCFAGSAALRLAKDLAENNRGARVLVVCAELTLMLFSGPKEGCFQTLVNQGLFGDGAGAVIVGADQASPGERPLFEMVSAAQTVVPDSDHAITMHLTKGGIRRKHLHPGRSRGSSGTTSSSASRTRLGRSASPPNGTTSSGGTPRIVCHLGPHRHRAQAPAREAGGEPQGAERVREHVRRHPSSSFWTSSGGGVRSSTSKGIGV
ncbi:hypothetical protein ACQ4PT_055720 [Festuca glaucescens]